MRTEKLLRHMRAIHEFYQEIAHSLIKYKCPRLFHAFDSKKLKRQLNISRITSNDGFVTYDDAEKAEIFNNFFQLVFASDNNTRM